MKSEIPWTFKTWIVRFKGVDLPIGDLAKDIVSDEDFPNEDYFSDIYDHLRSKHANSICLETFVAAWNYYLSSNADPDGFR